MGLETIGVFAALALLFVALVPPRARRVLIFVASVVAIYWLQPWLPLRYADFLLPTLTLVLTVLGWWLTRPQKKIARTDLQTLGALLVLVMLMGMNRYLAPAWRLTPSRPPSPSLLMVVLLLTGLALALLAHFDAARSRQKLSAAVVAMVLIFILLKTPALTQFWARGWRQWVGQDVALASTADLRWLGFSYVSFRLIHTLRDRQTGLLPDMDLMSYMSYVLFFPAYISGPIHRAEKFLHDWQNLTTLRGLDAARLGQGSARILSGMFKKFVIADTLALGMALTPELAQQTHSTLALWGLLYGYALRLYFDFAGYSDIAIGFALLLGIHLPENFKRPYLKTNITTFWQSWHISLSDWARFYIFSPLNRSLLRRKPRPHKTHILFLGLMATMLTIGLWHGIGWSFVIWGAWHGLGLFIHKQWSDRTRRWYRQLKQRPWPMRAWQAFSWALTFHFVVLGWVWFLLPSPALALHTLLQLFGK